MGDVSNSLTTVLLVAITALVVSVVKTAGTVSLAYGNFDFATFIPLALGFALLSAALSAIVAIVQDVKALKDATKAVAT